MYCIEMVERDITSLVISRSQDSMVGFSSLGFQEHSSPVSNGLGLKAKVLVRDQDQDQDLIQCRGGSTGEREG